MIFDKIENIISYGLDLQFIIDDIKKRPFTTGIQYINTPDHFVIGLEYETQGVNKAIWEAHRKYLDIHVILEGEEIINISDIRTMRSISDYKDDYQLFKGEKQQSIHLTEGYFLVLFPHEVHQTSIMVNKSIPIIKNVYKRAF